MVEIKTSNEGKYLKLEIIDNGIGIAKSHMKHIFEKFYRVPTGNVHDVKGFGIGLYYVKRMVEAHKAKMEIISEPGRGSQFIIKFLGS